MLFINKSPFQQHLFEHLFKTLSSVIQLGWAYMDLAVDIIETTGRLATKSEKDVWWGKFDYDQRRSIIYHFCSSLPHSAGWIRVVEAIGLLTGTYNPYYKGHIHGNSGWIYKALESVMIVAEDPNKWNSNVLNGVAGLLNALHYYNVPAQAEHIHLILRALSHSGDISKIAARLLLQENMEHWFEDSELKPILQRMSVWSSLTRVVLNEQYLTERYILNGYKLANTPDWQPHINGELTSWILIFHRNVSLEDLEKYATVLCNIGKTDTGGYRFKDSEERVLGTSYAALNEVWMEFDFKASGSLEHVVLLLYCISAVVLQTRYGSVPIGWIEERPITIGFTMAFSGALRDCLMYAAQKARESITQNRESVLQKHVTERNEALEDISRILEGIAGKMSITATDLDQEDSYWWSLRKGFDEKINMLEKSLQNMSVSGETPT
ncbi:hypothetical protein C8R44DRAFT_806367 [Mycena epipterygia]|nr:hypothetical protein C8R44DRAFT_806367 [Mycena epipterygia]